jgi:chemotaxis protein MotB
MASDSIIIKKKKVVGHGGHHGGSWKVAYADFVTAMMAFFMVLWIMGLSDDTQAAISGYFNDPAGFMKSNPRSKNVINVIQGTAPSRTSNKSETIDDKEDIRGVKITDAEEGVYVRAEIEKSLSGIPNLKTLNKNIEVKVDKEGLRIELLEDKDSVFFQSGSATISDTGRKLIKKLSPILANTGRPLIVEGHTDRKPYAGAIYTNWELSSDRARAMRQLLAMTGIPKERFQAVTGYADTRLLRPGRPLDPSNRRVTLLLPWNGKKESLVKKPTEAPVDKPKIAPPPFDLNPKKNSH